MMRKFADRIRLLVSPKGAEETSALPPGERIYAIGDIHGRADLLELLQEMIVADAQARGQARNRIVYLGDYIDRGPDSRAVMSLVQRDDLDGFAAVHLRGNHEAMMDGFMAAPMENSGWLHSGGDAVLHSFGIAAVSEFAAPPKLAEAAQALDRGLQPREREFLRRLQPSYRMGDYFFAHAGVDPHVPLEDQQPEDLMWIRQPFLTSKADFGAVVVHGHSMRREVEIRRNRIGIDTGAYASGQLTALGLQGRERWLLQTPRTA